MPSKKPKAVLMTKDEAESFVKAIEGISHCLNTWCQAMNESIKALEAIPAHPLEQESHDESQQ